MGSKILSHALLVIPRNPTQCLPSSQKLGFSTTTHHGSPFSASRVSVSRTSSSSFGSNLDAVVSAFAIQRLVARAEPESAGGDAMEETENVVVVEEAGAVAVLEGEEVSAVAEEVVKEPWQPRVKLGDVMGILNRRAVEASEKERPIPDLRTGDIVQIKLEVPENKRRLSIYKGIVISRQNAGIHTTIRVRRIIAGIGVEIVFPLYSPNIKEIKVVKHRKVRRARLYYLRDKLPRLSTFK